MERRTTIVAEQRKTSQVFSPRMRLQHWLGWISCNPMLHGPCSSLLTENNGKNNTKTVGLYYFLSIFFLFFCGEEKDGIQLKTYTVSRMRYSVWVYTKITPLALSCLLEKHSYLEIGMLSQAC